MARKKVKLQWISNDSARRTTYKKRNKSLVKKVSELSTLCGVGACAIIHSPYEQQPEIWPNRSDAHRVLTRFKSLPDMEKGKKMLNQESFIRDRINKLTEHVKKQQKENKQHEVAELMNRVMTGISSINDVGMEDLTNMACMVEMKMNAIEDRIKGIRNVVLPISPTLTKAPTPIMEDKVINIDLNHSALNEAMEDIKRQRWFVNIMNPEQHNGGVGNNIHPCTNNFFS